jgi:cyclase
VAGARRAVAALKALGARTVVAGHGAVTGPEVLEDTDACPAFLQRPAREGLAAGRTPLETARAAGLGRFGDWPDAERLVPNLHRAYAEERGQAVGDAAETPALFAGTVEFRGGLPACHA